MQPAVVRPDEAHRIQLYDVVFRYAIGADQTDGALSMIEVTIPPKTLVKPHLHTREDEMTLILDGAVGARLGDETVEEIPAAAGSRSRATSHTPCGIPAMRRLASSRSSCRAAWSATSSSSRRSS